MPLKCGEAKHDIFYHPFVIEQQLPASRAIGLQGDHGGSLSDHSTCLATVETLLDIMRASAAHGQYHAYVCLMCVTADERHGERGVPPSGPR
jgi:hypothetical protein